MVPRTILPSIVHRERHLVMRPPRAVEIADIRLGTRSDETVATASAMTIRQRRPAQPLVPR